MTTQDTITAQQPNFSVIIVAAGTGNRMDSDLPKQYMPLCGKPVIRHSLETFLSLKGLQQIHVAIHADHIPLYEAATQGLNDLGAPVIGGATRQETVYKAVMSLDLKDEDIVLIHDAARPCIAKEDILSLLSALKTHRAASLAAPVTETIRIKNGVNLGGAIDRETIVALQTPQAFRAGDLKKAHQTHKSTSFTDDTAIVSANGIEVAYITSSKPNPKITTQKDLSMARAFLDQQATAPLFPRTASGFDVHAFGDTAEHIRLGGIDIPHTHRLSGHSDADVVLHAVTDAIYGVLADGDIGAHFPPSDPSHKGKDSSIFLEHACTLMEKRGGTITHIDVTIMCEAPKIGPHREKIRERIADITALPLHRVAVKATTTEGLGFTGRREGIAVQSLVTAIFPDTAR